MSQERYDVTRNPSPEGNSYRDLIFIPCIKKIRKSPFIPVSTFSGPKLYTLYISMVFKAKQKYFICQIVCNVSIRKKSKKKKNQQTHSKLPFLKFCKDMSNK